MKFQKYHWSCFSRKSWKTGKNSVNSHFRLIGFWDIPLTHTIRKLSRKTILLSRNTSKRKYCKHTRFSKLFFYRKFMFWDPLNTKKIFSVNGLKSVLCFNIISPKKSCRKLNLGMPFRTTIASGTKISGKIHHPEVWFTEWCF